MQQTNRPIRKHDRIESLDTLRGFALLGILLMNIQSFAMIDQAYMNPTAFGSLSGANYWVWFLSHLFADTKFISVFSMLFGAGIVLFAQRQEQKNTPSAAMHYRRMFGLFLFGICHAYLIWPGDILVPYAICGSMLFLVRNWSPRTQLISGLLTVAVASAIYCVAQIAVQFVSVEELANLVKEWQASPEGISKQIAIYRGSWLGQLPHRASSAFILQTYVFAIFIGWRTAGCMLMGMALYRWKVLTGEASKSTYWLMVLIGFAIGLPTIAFGVHRNFAVDWNVRYSFFQGSQFNYWGSLAVALGYVGLINLLVKTTWFAWPASLLANVGRMALTNYLMQSIICSFVFYGHGLGLYCKLSRLQQFGVVLAIWVTQLIISPLWLNRFRYGPVEWLWRSMSYGKWQPLRSDVPS